MALRKLKTDSDFPLPNASSTADLLESELLDGLVAVENLPQASQYPVELESAIPVSSTLAEQLESELLDGLVAAENVASPHSTTADSSTLADQLEDELLNGVVAAENPTSKSLVDVDPQSATSKSSTLAVQLEDELLDGLDHGAHNAVPKRALITDDLAQFIAFAEKSYDDAVPLRSDLLSGPQRAMRLAMVKRNQKQIQICLGAYENWHAAGNSLRERDLEHLEWVAVLNERILGIIAIESGQMHLSSVEKIQAWQARARPAARESIIDDPEKNPQGPSFAIDVSSVVDSDVVRSVVALKRAMFRRGLSQAREQSDEKAERALFQLIKSTALATFLLVMVCGLIYWQRPQPVEMDITQYRKVCALQSAFGHGKEFHAIVAPSWKNLLPEERIMQLTELSRYVPTNFKRVKVMDAKGLLFAEYFAGDVTLYRQGKE